MEHKKILILEQNDIGMSGFSIRITVIRQGQIISGLHNSPTESQKFEFEKHHWYKL